MPRPAHEDKLAKEHWAEFNERKAAQEAAFADKPDPSQEEKDREFKRQMAALDRRLKKDGVK